MSQVVPRQGGKTLFFLVSLPSWLGARWSFLLLVAICSSHSVSGCDDCVEPLVGIVHTVDFDRGRGDSSLLLLLLVLEVARVF